MWRVYSQNSFRHARNACFFLVFPNFRFSDFWAIIRPVRNAWIFQFFQFFGQLCKMACAPHSFPKNWKNWKTGTSYVFIFPDFWNFCETYMRWSRKLMISIEGISFASIIQWILWKVYVLLKEFNDFCEKYRFCLRNPMFSVKIKSFA